MRFLLLLLFASFRFLSDAQVISSFTPLTAKPGAQIRIQGTGFSATAASNLVYFGGLRANVDSSNATNVYVRVPLGVQTATIKVIVSGVMGESKALFNPLLDCGLAPYSGSVNPKVDFAATSGNPNVVLADIDGDGKLDITTGNSGTTTVSILRNLMSPGATVAAGAFATKVDITAGSGPRIHTVADMDLDGKPDLLVPNYSSNNISVIRNTSTAGSVSFATKVDFSTGSGPFHVATGDLDADGRPEMVVVNTTSGNISVYRNISSPGSITSGSFSLSTTITTGSSAYSVAIDDIDGDGKRDLAVVNSGANSISLIRNTTTTVGTITFAAKYDITGTSTGGIASRLVDLDGDGKPELIVTRANGTSIISIYRNTATSGTIGASTFASAVNLTTGSTPQFFDVADMDGDGKPDLVFPNSGAVSFGIIKNNCTSGNINTGTFSSVVNYVTGTNPTGLSTGDVNQDSIPDVAVANQSTNTVSIFQGTVPRVRATVLLSPFICKGTTAKLVYVKTGNFVSSNTFTAQLSSDTLGSFVSPVAVGTKASTISDTIIITIPAATPEGRYRLRVVSSAPVTGCSDTGIWVNIYESPTVNAGSDNFLCIGDSIQLNGSATGTSYSWSPATGLSSTSSLTPFSSATVTTDYYLTASNTNCTVQDTVRITANNCCVTCKKVNTANNNLVMCLPFNGNANDESGNGYNGTVYNASLTSDRFGNANKAYSFNGTTSNIELSKNIPDQTALSLSLWIKPVVNPSATKFIFFEGTSACGNDLAIGYGTNQLVFIASKSASLTGAAGAGLVNLSSSILNKWTHVVLTVTSTQCRVYINGTLHTSFGVSGSNVGFHFTPTIGCLNDGNSGACGTPKNAFFTGDVDDIRLYNTAIAATDVAHLYTLHENGFDLVVSDDKYICSGDSVQLGYAGATTYQWNTLTGLSDSTSSSPFAKPGTTSEFNVKAGNSAGCVVYDTVMVTVQNNCCLNCLAETSINNSLRLCLPYDGGTQDKSSNAATGTINGGVSLTSDHKGVANKAYDFNGSNGYINYPNSTALSSPGSNFSFAAWVNVRGWTNILGTNIAPLMAKSNASSSAQYAVGLLDKGVTVINNAKVWSFNNQSYSFNTNQWYYVVIVVSNNQLLVYVDGNLKGTYTAPSGTITASSSNSLNIGRSDPGLTGYFNGRMEEIRIYDRTLSAAEIATLYLGKDALQTSVRSDTTICKNQSVTLTSSGATGYLWSPGQLLSDSTIASPVVTLTDSTQFRLKSTDGNCLKRDTVKIYVNKVTATVSNDTTICEQASVQLIAGGGTSYSWSPAAGLSGTNVPDPTATPATTTNYKVTVTKFGCTATDSVLVTIHNKFVPVLSNDTLLCPVYTNVPLSASGTGVVTYSWRPGNFLSDSTIAGPVAFPTYTTTFKVTMSDGICTLTDSVTVTRDTSLHAVASNDTTICEQNSVQLTASGGSSYAWSPGAGLSATNISNPLASPSVTTKYYVDVSDAFCTLRDSVTVTIKNKFTPVVSNDTSICKGSSLQLNAFGTGVISYRWRPGTYLSDTTSANPVTTPVTNILYKIVMSDGVCVVTDSVLITRDTLLIASVSNDTTICKGDTAQLFASGGLTYQWSSPGTLNYANIPNPVSYATSTLKYYVDVSDAKCTVRDSVLLTVINFNKVTAPADTNICKGDSVLLSASGTGVYTWTPTLGLADPYNKLTKASPPFTITYAIQTNTLGCISYDTVTVSVQTQVASVVNTSQDTTICQGDTAVLLATSSEPSTVFTWSTGATTPLIVVKPNLSTWFKVNTKVGSCVGTADSTYVTVLAKPKAQFSINPADSGFMAFEATFKNLSTNATNYSILFGDSFNVEGTTADTEYVYKYPGLFAVKLMAYNQHPGCADSILKFVHVKDIVSIFIPNAFSPNKDGINDTFRVVMTGIKRCFGSIYDKWGEEIYTQRSNSGTFEWDGTFKGELVQLGVYYYILQYFEETKKKWYTTVGEIHILE